MIEPLPEHVTVAEVRPAGEPLAALLERGRRERDAGGLCRGLARAVAALHARGTPHGGLHPGAAIVLGDGRIVLTAAGAPIEPPALASDGAGPWSAPEILRGGCASRPADVFALGAIAYRLLAGRRPFEGGDPLDAARRVLFEAPLPLALLRPDLSPDVCDAVDRALEKRPGRRPAAAELAEAFGRRSGVREPAGPLQPGPLPPPPAGEAGGPFGSGRVPSSPARPSGMPPWAAARRSLRALREASPLGRLALVALPLGLALAAGLPRDPPFAREVGERLDAGDLAGARAALDRAGRADAGDPWIEKVRGDLACARGDAGECLRRYAAALDARPGFAADPRLRASVVRLIDRGEDARSLVRVAARVEGIDGALVDATASEHHDVRWAAIRVLEARGRADRIDYASAYARDLGGDAGCGARRAAAARLAELRDPRVLPSLEAARRDNAGLGGWLCVGGEVDRALRATRAVAER
jgi:hypothetical protein